MKNSTTFLGAAVLLLTVTLCPAQSTQTFTFQGNVFQTYVVPTSGWYLIDAKGAQGGPAGSHVGGKGARMQAYAQLLQGDILRIAIGGAGNSGSNDGNNVSGGGGGGASSVVNQTSGNTLLVMAGGGGGAGSNHDGDPGLVTTNGGSSGGSGGTNGSGGGISADNRGGGGGGGYSGGGGTHCDGNCSGNNILAQGGSAYIVDNFGGASTSIGGFGGWGGGGQGGPAINNFLNNNDGGGGGGGGYSGGGGGTEGRGGSATGTGGSSGGGGGGSFVSNNLNTSGCVAVNGENSGNGLVSVQLMNYTYVQPVDTGFTFQGNVFQYFTAPATGYYSVSARGAQGGAVNGANGGKGAHIQGAVLLSAGEILRIAVGGSGRDGEYGILSSFHENNSLGCSAGTNRAYWTGGGGGGASSIVALQNGDFIPLMIAAGGGGAANYFPGNPGSCTSSGTTSASPYSTAYVATTAAWGDNGNGGSGANAAGGGGFYSSGITSESVISNDVCIQSAYGQGYLSGNYGGFAITAVNQVVVAGGWGGGASGAFYDEANTRSFDGSGGGGGGYNGGGGGNRFYDPNQTSAFPFGGGGGGSLSQALCGRSDSSGVNTGNGSVSISGPNVTIDTVNTPGPTYTWAANGVTYQHSGTYYHVDQANCIVQVLDLSIGGLGGCLNYTRIDTTIVSCGSYTSPLNGRTYTENTTDSIRVGCTKYVVRLIVAAPAVLPGNMITGSVIQPGNMITGSTSPTSPLSVCKNSTGTYSIAPVPYATSYQWTLPSGAIGTSTTNSITVSFGNNFSGGNICVTPVNACGSGEVVCKAITLLNTPPTGPLQITGPSAPFISGNYSVTPIAGATTYTWSVSNNQAVIVSGQGTPSIQLEALPGFTHANLSVRASNCRGNGSRGTLALKANGNGPGAALPVRMAAVEAEMMSVYPNPSNGQFTLNTPMLDTDAMVEVYSTEGRLVFQKIIAANTTQTSIDLQQAASGLYQLRVVSGEEVKTARVVVE